MAIGLRLKNSFEALRVELLMKIGVWMCVHDGLAIDEEYNCKLRQPPAEWNGSTVTGAHLSVP